MRFVFWQQAVVIVCFVGMLLVYGLAVYRVTRKTGSLRAALGGLVGAAAAWSFVWLVVGLGLRFVTMVGMADESVQYGAIERTYYGTFGFPFTVGYFDLLRSVVGITGVIPYLEGASIPTALLMLGGAIVGVSRWMERRRVAGKRATGLAGGAALAVVVVLLWPQSTRNPEMPGVPIPEGAIAVEYGHREDKADVPTTRFTDETQGDSQVLTWYREALEADGWQVIRGEAYETWPAEGVAVFGKDGKELEVSPQDSIFGSFVVLTLWPSEEARVGGQ